MQAEAFSDSLLKNIQDQDPVTILGAIVAVVVVILTIRKWAAQTQASAHPRRQSGELFRFGLLIAKATRLAYLTKIPSCFRHSSFGAFQHLDLVFRLEELRSWMIFFSPVFVKIFWGSKSTKSAVLLVGLCDSGKTLLFSRVRAIFLKFRVIKPLDCVDDKWRQFAIYLLTHESLRKHKLYL